MSEVLGTLEHYPVKDGKRLYLVQGDGSGLQQRVQLSGPYSEWTCQHLVEGLTDIASGDFWAATPEEALEQYGKTLPFGLMKVKSSLTIPDWWDVVGNQGQVLFSFCDQYISLPDLLLAKESSHQFTTLYAHLQAYLDDPHGDGVIACKLKEGK